MRLSPAELTALVDAKETSPHRFLGLHPLVGGGLVARSLFPWASACELVPDGPTKPVPDSERRQRTPREADRT